MRLLWAAVSLLLVTAVATAAEPRPEALVLGRADLLLVAERIRRALG